MEKKIQICMYSPILTIKSMNIKYTEKEIEKNYDKVKSQLFSIIAYLGLRLLERNFWS